MIGGKGAMEGKVGGAHVKGFSGEPVKEEGGSGKCVGPVSGRHGSLEEKSVNDIVRGAKHAFGFPVLL
jgi:hypothetical protein